MRAYYRTTEFQGGLAYLALALLTLRWATNVTLWGTSVTLVVASYNVSRAFMKKNRGPLVDKLGRTTSEFWMAVSGNALLLAAVFARHLDASMAFLGGSVIYAAYTWSRGHTKSFPMTTKVNFIR